MKAFALGRRSKWKDYIDLFYILKSHYSVKQISEKADNIYGQLFSEKLFRAQMSYFDDINYSEPIEYLIKHPTEKEIKHYLTNKAIEIY